MPLLTPSTQRAELESVDVLPDGQGFTLGFVAPDGQSHRLELPSSAVHQLMRLLPRLDAALLQARRQVTGALVAYPVAQWDLEPTGADDAVALSVRTDRRAEFAFLFDAADARAVHAALGQALAAGVSVPAALARPCII